MAFRAMISSKLPMVIIVGATGTGKTKLGVELAQKLGTEIISADSMQIYKGLDVVTAKASAQERAAVTHHLLDILEPHQMFTVVDFRNRALKIIDDLTEQGKIPIVVGGTNYYIESIVYHILVEVSKEYESLLWDRSGRKRLLDKRDDDDNKRLKIESEDKTDNDDESGYSYDKRDDDDIKRLKIKSEEKSDNDDEAGYSNVKGPTEMEPKEKVITPKEDKEEKVIEIDKEKVKADLYNEMNFTNEEMHEKLRLIDPASGQRLHPNNRRKVMRAIEVWLKTGRRHSEILAEQRHTEGNLRRPGSTILLWLKCEQSILDQRLDARVDAMLQQGLIEELLDFHARHNKQRIQDGIPPDYTKGVFQTVGLKEFHDYLMLPEDQRNTEEGKGKLLLQRSIANMKTATRRYARRQLKMIRGRFLEHPLRQVPTIYKLDATDLTKWDSNVKQKALNIIEAYLNGSECEYEPLKPGSLEEKRAINTVSNNICDVCNRLIIGDHEWDIHLKSNRHMKVVKKKLAEQQKMRPQDT